MSDILIVSLVISVWGMFIYFDLMSISNRLSDINKTLKNLKDGAEKEDKTE